MTDLQGKRIFVAGHRGMVGSAIVRRLKVEQCETLCADRSDVDLRDQHQVNAWFADQRPELVFVAAAKVGGILANASRPADFLYDNLMIAANVISAARAVSVEKLLFLGSSCIYPRMAPQPIQENALLTGPLEETNEWYAIAKIAGIKLCQAYRRQEGCDFISAMPTNLYGTGDNYDLMSSHVLPALIHKAHLVKIGALQQLELWGTGEPRREFLHADDCADACVFLMKNYSAESHVNVGFGTDISIRELAELVCNVVGIPPDLAFDLTKPDGTPRKLMDNSMLNGLGWKPQIALEEGIRRTYGELLASNVLGHTS
ncbi:NAD-dependent epimerase/dehydratase family protein [Sphingomonas sp. MAH-20]|uniref:GDP-L-fucose synthase n=1 Tax=Sphingomonas horti TaxID=2682842 RepID=A0A6I4J0F2_9SPHN|nr:MULTISPECIES: GDP-L-fucose synthase [Sphingomonas]MBA2919778.1 GDP-L-fucose synthase [Sphingomonas sp. CGMCC 1.13658]MVO78019.1 NAD-dependent epimerase/dehydratase family protein [Sphingomonas horti]